MKVKVFEKNDNGKIEFTRKELEALLNEVYNDGYQEGRNSKTWTWTSPSITSTPLTYYSTISCDTANSTSLTGNITLNSSDFNENLVEKVEYGVLN